MKKPQRHGFTLVELLVVIAIIGILVALLLPAVQAAREAARRMSCSNNMKQLSLACHNYHDTFKIYPDNHDGRGPIGRGRRTSYSWITVTLPFIEQAPLHDRYDFSRDSTRQFIDNNNNRALRQSVISVLNCPSNPHPQILNNKQHLNYDGTNGWNNNGARTDYVGNGGWVWSGWEDCSNTGSNGASWTHPDDKFAAVRNGGVFWYKGSARIADIIDGTSNTVAIMENHNWEGRIGNPPRAFKGGFNRQGLWVSPLAAIDLHTTQINNFPRAGNGNNDTRCTNWSSAHPGGAMAGLADGSARFVAETTDMAVLRAVITRAGGESQTFGD